MLPLDDKLWHEISPGPLGIAEVPRYLRQLFDGIDKQDVWDAFWSTLHHQGDVDDASYAAVPHLLNYVEISDSIDPDAVEFIVAIESCRPGNQPPRQEVAGDYFAAIRRAPGVLISHPDTPWSDRVTAASLHLISLTKSNANYAQLLNYLYVANAKETVKDEQIFKWIDQ